MAKEIGMAKKYEHLFFDLDHTLWDFEANSKITLHAMFDQYELGTVTGVTKDDFYTTYIKVNSLKWKMYSEGRISKEQLREERFADTFRTFGYYDAAFCNSFEMEYVATCPHQTQLMPGAMEILNYLNGRYELHIITNGFIESQGTKMNKSGIGDYFRNMFSSEAIGVNKPAPQIFEEALKSAGAVGENSLMIGDNLQADVIGARQCGMDQVYYNPARLPHSEEPTYEVDHLLQLKNFL